MSKKPNTPKYSIGMNVEFPFNGELATGEITFVGSNFIVVLGKDFKKPHREVVVENYNIGKVL